MMRPVRVALRQLTEAGLKTGLLGKGVLVQRTVNRLRRQLDLYGTSKVIGAFPVGPVVDHSSSVTQLAVVGTI